MTLTVICLLAATARADLPAGTRNEDNICYTFSAYKRLLQIDADLKAERAQTLQLDLKIQAQQEVIDTYRAIDVEQKNTIDRLAIENARIHEMWKEENRLRHEAENVPQWGGTLAWIVAGVATVAAGGAIGYAIAK